MLQAGRLATRRSSWLGRGGREVAYTVLHDRFIPRDGRRVERVLNPMVNPGRSPPAAGQEASSMSIFALNDRQRKRIPQ